MDIVLIGAGGHGRVVLDIIRSAGIHNPIGFIDAEPQLTGKSVGGIPVLGEANLLAKLRSQKIKGAIISIGDNSTRKSYARKLLDDGFELVNAIHPRSIVSPTAILGKNVVVAAGAIIGTDTQVADSAIINSGAVIGHECEIGEVCHVCPTAALAGRVRIGEEAFIGLGCKIIQCMQIGSKSIVGAGAVVIEDVPDGATAVGIPARIIKINRMILEPVAI